VVLLCQTYIEKVGKALLLPVLSVMNILKEKKGGSKASFSGCYEEDEHERRGEQSSFRWLL